MKKNFAAALPQGVTVSKRISPDAEFFFVQNFATTEQVVTPDNGRYVDLLSGETISSDFAVPALEVRVLKREKACER